MNRTLLSSKLEYWNRLVGVITWFALTFPRTNEPKLYLIYIEPFGISANPFVSVSPSLIISPSSPIATYGNPETNVSIRTDFISLFVFSSICSGSFAIFCARFVVGFFEL